MKLQTTKNCFEIQFGWGSNSTKHFTFEFFITVQNNLGSFYRKLKEMLHS